MCAAEIHTKKYKIATLRTNPNFSYLSTWGVIISQIHIEPPKMDCGEPSDIVAGKRTRGDALTTARKEIIYRCAGLG